MQERSVVEIKPWRRAEFVDLLDYVMYEFLPAFHLQGALHWWCGYRLF